EEWTRGRGAHARMPERRLRGAVPCRRGTYRRSATISALGRRVVMLALRCDTEPRLVRTQDEPVRKPGEALVRMRMAGVCDTDLQLARGYMGFSGVFGHEFVGEVIESDG